MAENKNALVNETANENGNAALTERLDNVAERMAEAEKATAAVAEEQKQIFLLWYMDIVNLLREEGKEEKGHLNHTLHLIADMHNLHLQLMQLPVGEHYRKTYAHLQPELPRLRELVGEAEMTDTELCFRALYAAMLYRIKGEGEKGAVKDTIEFVSPVVAELANLYRKVETGEIDLFKGAK